jgi:hypothetical protein
LIMRHAYVAIRERSTHINKFEVIKHFFTR